MPTTEDITGFVNKLIRREHGIPMRNDTDKLVDTGCDSFGITMLLLELHSKYGVYSAEYVKSLDIEELTLADIIREIKNASKGL